MNVLPFYIQLKLVYKGVLYGAIMLWSGNIYAQADTSKMIKYTPGFEFTEGIFLNFEQVKNNQPVAKARIVTSKDFGSADFFYDIKAGKKIYYFNEWGVKQSVNFKDIWGISRNGVLYINLSEDLFRVTIVGSICHFMAQEPINNNVYVDPYGRTYINDPRYVNQANTVSEMRQYMLHFETGKVYNYTFKNLESLLMFDVELHNEYIHLRRKKKKQLMFTFLRRFNERNPLYFPVTSIE